LGLGELVFVSKKDDQKPIPSPANYTLYHVAASTIPGLSLPSGTPTSKVPVVSNEVLDAKLLGYPYIPDIPEVFTIHCAEAYEIWYGETKLVAFETPRVSLLDHNVPHHKLRGPE
jgi:hypothetical protein